MLLFASFVILSKLVASELTNIINNAVEVKLDAPASTGKLASIIPSSNDPPLDFITMAKRDGYLAEEHTTTTKDGYILTIHRIVGKIGDEKVKKGLPAMFAHGLFLDSDMWLPPVNANIYGIVDKGIDVWFLNFRGTKYSSKHVNQTVENDPEAYWKFSFHEMGKYDLPASIDYTLNYTKSNSLNYVGFSQGTTALFTVQMPEYYNKIENTCLLAPIASLKNLKSPLLRLATTSPALLESIFALGDTYKLGGNASATNQAAQLLCSTKLSVVPCRSFLELVMGFDPEQMPDEVVPWVYKKFPESTSVRNFLHFGQQIHVKSQALRMMDLGSKNNQKEYGTSTPKEYNLSMVTPNITLFCGQNDLLSDLKDVDWLEKQLPNVREKYIVPRAKWNHYDHAWAKESGELVYEKILNIISESD